MQEGARCGFAPAAAGGDLVEARSLVGLAIQIGVEGEPGLPGRPHEESRQRMGLVRDIADMKRAAGTVPR
ncbi:hypothetical protein D3C72_2452810 [compost metagenome]